MLLVNQLCASVQPTEECLVKATSEYLTSLLKNGATFQDQTLMICKRWLLETLEYSESESQIDVLIALQTFFSTCAYSNYSQDIRKLLGENSLLCRFLYSSGSHSDELNFHSLCCLEAILINKEKNQITMSIDYLLLIKEIVLKILFSSLENEKYFKRKICTCVRILRIISSEKVIISSVDNIGELLGVIQAFLFCGIKDYPFLIPQQLRPAIMNIPVNTCTISKTKCTKKTRSKKQLPPKAVTNTKNESSSNPKFIPKFSSDSDTSDTELSFDLIQMDSKIRLETVQLLYNIVMNFSSRELFGYWTQIVASGSQINARVLTRLILKDSSYKVRQISWMIMCELLRGSRHILQHAEDNEHSSFITVFALLSSVIKEIHYTVSLSLNTEHNVAVLIHVLKCASTLAECTPYHRLKPELASELIRNCKNLTIHKDPAVRVAALGVFESLASSEPITPEIINSFEMSCGNDDSKCLPLKNCGSCHVHNQNELHIEGSSNHNSIKDFKLKYEHDKEISWILKICLENISDETVSVPVRLQSLKLLGVLADNIENLIYPHLTIMAEKLIIAAKDSVPQIVLHVFRVIDTIANQLETNNKKDDAIILFWNIICEPVINLLQHSEAILKEVACNCLGNIGTNVFSQLTREKSILIITLLFGATRDQQSAVRAAGLRTLGLLVTLAALEESTGFLMDLADITCLSLLDENLGVRIKAAWALASLCDCLIRIENNTELETIQLDILLPKIYESSVKAAKDSDKVKCNITRVIGSILYLSSNCQILADTSEGLESLIECATLSNDQKVKWNACRAIGLILSREPDSILPTSWKDQVFPTLSKLIRDSINFKVRTNAAWAISVCNSYGKYIVSLWKSVILALENSQHVPNYVEYAHRDNLVQQLCLTLSHLAVHTHMKDLLSLWTEIGDHVEDVTIYMKQFQNHILPEKAGDVINAQITFSKYKRECSTLEEREIANTLENLFT
ncbi:HEAT repeat-containing protein 6 isoform X2 [Leptopilina boulardi]|nr:HEAT repeat-containing protein 6 isoform X2 [Leptopilina boulardi]XP_051170044.1 HEAT repeat-containing protein 6 isoform X2 [Leptopilina boulardi]